jgi:uncharacterized protein DUF6448
MTLTSRLLKPAVAVSTLLFVLALPATARAHCDTLDGPVVKAAQRALATGNVTPALIWVQPAAEAEVRDVFTRTMAVRQLSAAARELADRYFYETVVRLHRAGEGEPFTGIEPAGYDVGPAIPAADRALESASLDALTRMLTADIDVTLRTHFDEVLAARAAMTDGDVPSGRAYVKVYVEFMHYVERLHEAATSEVHGLHDRDEP